METMCPLPVRELQLKLMLRQALRFLFAKTERDTKCSIRSMPAARVPHSTLAWASEDATGGTSDAESD